MEKTNNPFLLTGYKSPEYFCDRKEETKLLTQLMLKGTNITLFAIRRIGKTGIIQHVFYPYQNSSKTACIYLDILSTKNLADLTNQIATAVYNRFPAQKTLGKKIMELFQRFRPTISFDELSGTPSLSLTIETKAQKENTIGQIFNFLDKQNIKIVFAIDEFQQILEYPEKNTEAILRTHIQQLKNTSFIFCGSNQKMMHEIFNSAKRPFFASCTNLKLDYISEFEYKKFIVQKMKEHLFSINKSKYNIQDAHQTAINILKLNESVFFQYKNLLTKAQWNLLIAIAKEENVFQPQAKMFINKHQLGTPALVKRGIDALLNKELIFYNSGVDKPYYEVYDKFLMRWLQQNK